MVKGIDIILIFIAYKSCQEDPKMLQKVFQLSKVHVIEKRSIRRDRPNHGKDSPRMFLTSLNVVPSTTKTANI